jgi:hypothetical protein
VDFHHLDQRHVWRTIEEILEGCELGRIETEGHYLVGRHFAFDLASIFMWDGIAIAGIAGIALNKRFFMNVYNPLESPSIIRSV